MEDGTYLETSSARAPYGTPVADRLQIYSHPDSSVADLYACHLEHVVVHAEHTGSSAVVLTPAELDAAANYGRRLVQALVFWWRRSVQPPEFVNFQGVA